MSLRGTCAASLLGWLVLQTVSAQAQVAATPLPAVTVQAARLDIPPFDLPASFDAVPVAPATRGRAGINLSEVLVGVPGVLVRDRQNYAQDEQLSIRGFGARSTFGVRGVRLYLDGIPATMPDGQGQLSHFALDAADRIQVLRGPFSALYGNSSGGVVQLWTADGTPTPQTRLGAWYGSDATAKALLDTRGSSGAMDYHLTASHLRTDGYRDHSRARRTGGNAKLGFDLGDGARLTLVGNTLAQPGTQDPLGLSRAQFRADPRQATAVANSYDTRKDIHQTQLGAIYRQPLGEYDTLRLMAYGGRRNVRQILAIPPMAQAAPSSGGGVIDLSAGYGGMDARWIHRGAWWGRPLELVLGASYDAEDQRRHGYENFIGERIGVVGALRRDENDRVHDLDQYAQLYWHVAPQWALLAGLRHSQVRFGVDDHYIAAGNPDDSGSMHYSATTPVLGLQYRPSPRWRLYASAGEGFETPTFSELGYRADGGSGLAFDLRPARSRNYELGAKWQPRDNLQLDLALFRAVTRDELAVASNHGGRSTYRNIGHSRRQGAELSLHGQLGDGWRLRLGLTHLQATFRSRFIGCSGIPCFEPNTVIAAGTRIPGVPSNYGSLRLERGDDHGWRGGIELDGASAVPVNDANSESAPGYLRMAADIGYGLPLGASQLHLTARVDNLFDRRIVGSVIVNDGNGRYYEPAPGRRLMLGLQLDL